MTIVEIIIAELHCLFNGGHLVDCSASYVRDGRGCTKWDRHDGLTKNKENAYVPGPEQKMFWDRTEPTLFRAGTVPETVPVRSLETPFPGHRSKNIAKMVGATLSEGFSRSWCDLLSLMSHMFQQIHDCGINDVDFLHARCRYAMHSTLFFVVVVCQIVAEHLNDLFG